MEIQKRCKYCGRSFIAHKMTTLYCSPSCNNKDYKRNIRQKQIAEFMEGEKKNVPPVDNLGNKAFLTPTEGAQLLGISRATFYRYMRDGIIKAVQLRGKTIVRRKDIENLFDHPASYQPHSDKKQKKREYYTIRQISEKFKVTKKAILHRCEKYNIKKVYQGRNCFFDRSQVDVHFAELIAEFDLRDYYTIQQLEEKYMMSHNAVLSFVQRNKIPRITQGKTVYYSRAHIDTLKGERESVDPNYYTYAEIMEKYHFSKDQVSYYIHNYEIDSHKQGRFTVVNRKEFDRIIKRMVVYPITFGVILMFFSVWVFNRHWHPTFFTLHSSTWVYFLMSIVGTILCHIALDNISKHMKDGLMKDRFNFENESFEQMEEKVENKYSVNIPMRYYYKGKFRKGWVNVINPFRGTWVVGTPGSGKTFSIIEPFIRQHSAKGFAMVVYDYKFPTLAQKLYYHYRINKKAGKTPKNCQFNIINFVNVEYSRRVNPIQLKYISNLAAASETAETLLESLQKGKKEGGGGSDQFFQTSAVNFLAACIYFFCNYQKRPYDEDGHELNYDKTIDPETGMIKPTGIVRDATGNVTLPAYWLGKYSDMPHILSFLNESYETIFEVLMTDTEVAPLLGPFKTAFENKAMEQLEGMIGTLRVFTSRLATKESYWIFHKDGDDFDLKVSDPKHPSYLLIANDPEMESIIGALNALILNRLVTRVNTGQGKNVPVSIIVDELPTLYFHKIDRLIGTARSNKVSVALGFQELPQLEADYGKTGMQKIITTVGNVVSGSARAKETLEWLSNDIFGKVVQLKKGVTIDRDRTSVNLNENMDSLVPGSKIADMATGWICGQTARDFVKTKTGRGGSMDIQEAEEFQTSKFFCKTDFNMAEISKEEADYANYPIPQFYHFDSPEVRERILYSNFLQVNQDVKDMIKEIQEFNKK